MHQIILTCQEVAIFQFSYALFQDVPSHSLFSYYT